MKTLCVICSAILVCFFAVGCSDRSVDELPMYKDPQVSSIADTVQSLSSASSHNTTAQTSTFENSDIGNEPFDFDEAVKSICLFGNTISIPCKVSELGDGFTLVKQITYERNGNDDLIFDLMYNDALIGSGILEDCSMDEDNISDKLVVNLELCVEQYSYPHFDSELKWLEEAGIFSGFIDFKFAGLDFLSTPEDIKEVMGQPHNINELYSNEELLGTWYVMKYEYESGSISFEINNKTELRGIEIDVIKW